MCMGPPAKSVSPYCAASSTEKNLTKRHCAQVIPGASSESLRLISGDGGGELILWDMTREERNGAVVGMFVVCVRGPLPNHLRTRTHRVCYSAHRRAHDMGSSEDAHTRRARQHQLPRNVHASAGRTAIYGLSFIRAPRCHWHLVRQELVDPSARLLKNGVKEHSRFGLNTTQHSKWLGSFQTADSSESVHLLVCAGI